MRRLVILALCVLPLLLAALGLQPAGAVLMGIPDSPAPEVAFNAHQSAEIPFIPAGTDVTSFPDSTIASSSTRIITAVNAQIKIFNTTGSVLAQTTLQQFFGLGAGVSVYNPRLLFVPSVQRFVLVAAEIDRGATKVSRVRIAVSNNAFPTTLNIGNWRLGVFDAGLPVGGPFTSYAEIAGVGFDGTNLYVTVDNYDYNQNPGNYIDTRLAVFPWSNLASAAAIAAPTFSAIPNLPAAQFGVDARPFHAAPVGGEGASILICAGNPFQNTNTTGIAFYLINPGTGAVSGPAVLTNPELAWTRPGSPFTDSGRPVRLFDYLEKATVQNGELYVTQTVRGPLGGNAAIRLLRFASGPVLRDVQLIEDPDPQGVDYYFACAAPDLRGNATVVFQSGSVTETIGIMHARYVRTGTNTGYFETPRLALQSTFPFIVSLDQAATGFPMPWGRYTDAVIDRSSQSDGYALTHAELTQSNFVWRTIVNRVPTRIMKVISPNGGEIANPGGTLDICWQRGSANPGQNVRIRLARDGVNFNETIHPGTEDDGVFTWNVTGPVTIHARVRVDIVGTNFVDESDADFQIVDPNVATDEETFPDPGVPIPDNWQNNSQWVEVPLFLDKDLQIQTISVEVDVRHPYPPDLEIYLVHPDGSTPVVLHDQSGVPQLGPVPPNVIKTYPVPNPPDEGTQSMLNKLLLKRSRLWDSQGQELPWKIRVRDLNATNIGYVKRAKITVNGPEWVRIAVTRPNGGERFLIGTPDQVTWTTDINNPVNGDVDIVLDRNGDLAFNPAGDQVTLGTVPVETGVFNIPSVPGPQALTARVIVRSVTDPQQVDASDDTFEVRDGFIEVLSPNGGGPYFTGQVLPITWDRLPVSGNVSIQIESPDAGFPKTVVASTENDGSFDWVIPDGFDTAQARVRVTSIENPLLTDDSNASFAIITKRLEVLAPNGAEDWFVDETHNITWDSDGLGGNVKIELTRDASNATPTWETLFENTANDGSQPWVVTGPPSSDVKVRITSVSEPAISDSSDAPFTIGQATLTVTEPAAPSGESGFVRLAIGKLFSIRWTSTPPLTPASPVRIEIQRGEGAWELIAASTSNDGEFTWLVTGPANPANITSRIRITALDYPSTHDESAPFKVVAPGVTVLQPNGGEGLGIGLTYQIRWDGTPLSDPLNPSTVKIELNRNGGSGAWEELAANEPNDGAFDWLVTGPDTTQALVRISVTGGVFPSETDVSDAVFRIGDPGISVSEPHADEQLFVGTHKLIKWSAVGVENLVKIEVSRDSGATWSPIPGAEGLPVGAGAAGFDWLVTGPPNALPNRARIRVSSVDNPAVNGVSGLFDIKNYGLQITSPTGSPTWGIGVSRKIKWTFTSGYTGTADVYVRHAGEAVDTLIGSASAPGGNGELDWGVNGPPGTATITVKVPNAQPSPDTEASTTVNIVQPGITVTAPALNAELRVGQPTTFTWTNSGLEQDDQTLGHVNIFISRNGGAFQPIPGLQNIVNTGSAGWTPTGPDSDDVRIRVTSVELPGATDDSDAFKIVTPGLTITKPEPGDVFIVGESTTIEWAAQGVAGPLLIELSRNGGGSWETIQAGVPAGQGSITWVVTGGSSNNCRIRITSQNAADSVVATMPGSFTIVAPTVTVGTPNGGQSYLQGSTQNITWSTTGIPASEDVKIELLKGGAVVQTIAAATENDGIHPWVVPADTGANFTIRISRSGSPAASDDSDSSFSIVAPTLVVNPPKPAIARRNRPLNITWSGTVVGQGGTVDVFLSRNGGATFVKIISATANDGQVTWVVRGAATNRARIRIVWNPNPSVSGTSGNFRIR